MDQREKEEMGRAATDKFCQQLDTLNKLDGIEQAIDIIAKDRDRLQAVNVKLVEQTKNLIVRFRDGCESKDSNNYPEESFRHMVEMQINRVEAAIAASEKAGQ